MYERFYTPGVLFIIVRGKKHYQYSIDMAPGRSFMKRAAIVFILAVWLSWTAAAATIRRVQVRRTTLRRTPSAFGRRAGSLYFNDKVRIIKTERGFHYVYSYRLRSRGYVYKSAVVAQNRFNSQYVQLRDSGAYSRDAITAATKGFSRTEIDYSRRHRGSRYDLVHRIIRQYRFKHSESWWQNFRKVGALGEYRKKIRNRNYVGMGTEK